jgi:hypothetical protein
MRWPSTFLKAKWAKLSRCYAEPFFVICTHRHLPPPALFDSKLSWTLSTDHSPVWQTTPKSVWHRYYERNFVSSSGSPPRSPFHMTLVSFFVQSLIFGNGHKTHPLLIIITHSSLDLRHRSSSICFNIDLCSTWTLDLNWFIFNLGQMSLPVAILLFDFGTGESCVELSA